MPNVIDRLIAGAERKSGKPFAELMEANKMPSISIACAEGYELTETRVIGVKHPGEPDAVTPETLYQAASISKVVFAAGVMRLVEQGKIDLDRDICEYVKDYGVPTLRGRKYPVTLRTLLSHTAGLTVHGFYGYTMFQPVPTVTQVLNGEKPANSAKVKVKRRPGIKYEYSGGGTTMAQKAVCDACAADMQQLMDELVFGPFGMSGSMYIQPLPEELRQRAAWGMRDKPIAGCFHVYPELAAAGLWTTPSDLVTFGIELMNGLRGKSALISQATMEAMLTQQTDTMRIGVGFKLSERDRAPAFFHSGANEGFVSHLWMSREGGRSLCFMVNSSYTYDVQQMLISVVDECFE